MIEDIRQSTGRGIRQICEALGVPRSSYYHAAQATPMQQSDQHIGDLIEVIFKRHRRRYGHRRIWKELADHDVVCAPDRVRRIMRERGLRAIQPKTYVPRTSDGRADKPSPNLLIDQPLPEKPDQVWAGDITYIPTSTGWLYLAVVIDLCSRKIIGWSLANNLRAQLVVDALRQAIGSRSTTQKPIFHSDRGSQYGSSAFREVLRQVVQALRRRYAGRFDLIPLLWENLPLQPDMSFQRGIDAVLSERGVDVAVFILWVRLGSPTGPLVVNEIEQKIYRSGTEREFDLMMRAREQSRETLAETGQGRIRPDILFYLRRDDASFEERFRKTTTEEKEELTTQKKLAESFFQEHFIDPETGQNKAAYVPYDVPATFQKKLRIQIQDLLDAQAGGLESPVWDIETQGLPYLVLKAYDVEHAPIFLGREDEIVQVRQALQVRAREGSAFVLVSGASGSGKSSLARAGVLPAILENEKDAVVTGWLPLIVRPARRRPGGPPRAHGRRHCPRDP